MANNTIIIRIQSPSGTRRIQTKPTERTSVFLEKIKDEFDLDRSGGWALFVNRNKTGEVSPSRNKTLNSYKIKHGDMLYLSPGTSGITRDDDEDETAMEMSSTDNTPATGSQLIAQKSRAPAAPGIQEDDVDKFLWKQDGRIERPRSDQLCHHGPQGKCLHCVPLEPYDEKYLASMDPPIKFLSFHSYLRKLTGGVDKGKFAMLENLSCKIKPGCREHPPWPGGICTKCQPNAVTLNRQKYRHVDYIQFENPYLVEQFLNYWRTSGNQRIGIMYGKYEHHKDTPLGIKAVVVAIYEPPQHSTSHTVELLEDHMESHVKSVAKNLGLVAVGWIFTDLEALDLKKGTVKNFRGNVDSHFLSAEECITAADFQNRHPNPCKLSPDGHFGSKFVTVVVTGDDTNQIHFEGYQVSNQCMALVNDDCLVPTRDAPELGYVTESSNEQYVPDVFYTVKDEYGNEVTQLARPLPVEYLLVDLPAAFPVEPEFTFHGSSGSYKSFPVEGREGLGQVQDFNAFSTYMQQFPPDKFLEAVCDFHLLVYMSSCDMLPLKNHMSSLYEAVKSKDETLAHHWTKTEEWATVEQLIAANSPSPMASRQTSFTGPNPAPLPPIGGATSMWTCKHCTFLNAYDRTACDMCSLPK